MDIPSNLSSISTTNHFLKPFFFGPDHVRRIGASLACYSTLEKTLVSGIHHC
jgi:hypothetical protein